MPSVVDVWRAVDPAAELLSGEPERLRVPVRGVERTRAAPPHLPPIAPGELLIVDATVLAEMESSEILDRLAEASGEPCAVVLAGVETSTRRRYPATRLPILATATPASTFTATARDYLEREHELLERSALELRVVMAEAALRDPRLSAPAAVASARIRRGVALARRGRLVSVHARRRGRTLALRFTATFRRLFAAPSQRRQAERRTRDGLWLAEFPLDDDGPMRREAAAVWLFDDVPFAAIDRVAARSLARTLSALAARAGDGAERETAERRPRDEHRAVARAHHRPEAAASRTPHDVRLRDTILAVARTNGRVAPAARSLGVHRNTVLYRLRQARNELGIDPRRPDDALRVLRDVEGRRRRESA